MPGPRASFPQMGQPLAKGKEQAADEQPMQSSKRHSDETWLIRAMEKMECQLHAAMWCGLGVIAHSMGELETCVTNVEGHVTSSEDNEQEDDGLLESDQWGRPHLTPTQQWVES